MKQIIAAGNLTKDAAQRRTQSGDPVTSFSVAVNDPRTKDTTFFDCSLWGVRGDKVAPYLTKGTKVTVIGDLGRREHEGRTYLTINVSELTLMGGGAERQQARQPDDGDSYGNRPANFSDDIPFMMEWR